MSLLKTIFAVFSQKPESKASVKASVEYLEHGIEVPDDYFEKQREKQAPFVRTAAIDTLSLVTGIPDEIKEEIISKLTDTQKNVVHWEVAEEIFPKVENLKWSWSEWDYWSEQCVKLNLCPRNMPWPLPDELNLEQERKNYSPDKVFNLMTLAVAKERLSDFPEVGKMKKTDLIEFLKSKESAWNDVIDPHIEKKWNSKKHYPGALPRDIFKCLIETIHRRGNYLQQQIHLKDLDQTTVVSFFFEDDEVLYNIAKNDPKCPWKKNYGHPVPNGDVVLQLS